MPEIIIKYNDPKTLQILKDLSGYFNYSISRTEPASKQDLMINGVSIIPADNAIDISILEKIFSGKNLDAIILRQKAWKRG